MATNVTVKWRGNKYSADVQKSLKRAIVRAAENVRTTTRKALNVSGQTGGAIKALNKVSPKLSPQAKIDQKLAQGQAMMGKSLSGFQSKKGGLFVRHGGTYSHTDQKTGQTDTATGVYWYGEPVNKWVKASEVGTPPHKQSGDLQRSIEYSVSANGLEARVGPLDELKYARRQELGGPVSYPARPYLGPSYYACLPKIKRDIAEALKKAGRR